MFASHSRTSPTASGEMVDGAAARATSATGSSTTSGRTSSPRTDVSQWGWVWGQFLDHDLRPPRRDAAARARRSRSTRHDPLERFRNDLGAIDFSRTPAAPGHRSVVAAPAGRTRVPSYIDAFARLRRHRRAARLAARRAGRRQPDEQQARRCSCPAATCRRPTPAANAATAPAMDLMGPLAGTRRARSSPGDVRANENIALTAIQTLFAREHNRIVGAAARQPLDRGNQVPDRPAGRRRRGAVHHLPRVPARARRHLAAVPRLRPRREPALSNEFATVGFRAHSMVHGEFEPDVRPAPTPARQLDAFAPAGSSVERARTARSSSSIPLGRRVRQPRPARAGRPRPAARRPRRRAAVQQRRADRRHAAQRPVPGPEAGHARSGVCGDAGRRARLLLRRRRTSARSTSSAAATTACRTTTTCGRVRARAEDDSFTAITGESTDRFPRDRDRGTIRSTTRASSTSSQLRDVDGNACRSDDRRGGGRGRRACGATHARRAAEGDLRRASTSSTRSSACWPSRTSPAPSSASCSWRSGSEQFEALRDGDRFFYLNDPGARRIRTPYGIDYRHIARRRHRAEHERRGALKPIPRAGELRFAQTGTNRVPNWRPAGRAMSERLNLQDGRWDAIALVRAGCHSR